MAEPQQTFLFADLAGYTALTEAHGDEFAANAVTEFCTDVRALLAVHGAEHIKTVGDAVMLRARDPASAVKLAVDIVDRVGRRHGGLAVRVGVHTGTAVERDGDWFGAGVNVAARVAGAGDPGEIVMTAATRHAASGELDQFDVRYRGARRLRNVADPIELYALTLAAQRGAAGLPIDPVCRMAIDPSRSAERRTHRDQRYVFCSAECALIFDRHPDRYATGGVASPDLLISDDA